MFIWEAIIVIELLAAMAFLSKGIYFKLKSINLMLYLCQVFNESCHIYIHTY